MKKIIVILAFAALLITPGCLKRNVVMVNDHPTRPLTMVETYDQYTLFGYQVGGFWRFWTCTDQGDALDCKVECDGETDLDCIGGGIGR